MVNNTENKVYNSHNNMPPNKPIHKNKNKKKGGYHVGWPSKILKKIVYLLCITVSVSYGEIRTSTSLFDTPTAYIHKGVFYELTLSTTMTASPDPHPIDSDIHLMLSLFDRIEMSLSYLTIRDFNISPSIKYRLVEERERIPAISVGVLNLWTSRYISSLGRDKYITWEDDATYICPPYRRSPEQNSFYLVFTKDFGPWGRYNIGFGRGVFVGYGPRSKQFNTDRFHNWDPTHRDAVGMFWGGDIEIRYGIYGGLEFDGRDFNIGFNFRREGLEIRLVAEKIEHRLGGWEELMPRIDLSATFNHRLLIRPPPPPRVGAVAGRVVDIETGEPLMAIITVTDLDIEPVITDEDGRYTVTLEEGTYLIRVTAEGYYWIERKVYVREGMETVWDFSLMKR